LQGVSSQDSHPELDAKRISSASTELLRGCGSGGVCKSIGSLPGGITMTKKQKPEREHDGNNIE
jgi:hypothetical protein